MSEGSGKPVASIYDAVGVRLSRNGFVGKSNRPIPPDEALFRARPLPECLTESDIYYANRDLGSEAVQEELLPDSDLLKGLHAFASDFFADSLDPTEVTLMIRSMDGSALLALGFLIHEQIKECLGETGYLAFLERVEKIPGKKADDGRHDIGADHTV